MLKKRWKEAYETLGEIELPNSLEWADENIPHAREYIEKTHADVMLSITFGKERDFKVALEKYTKAWFRLWQRMAVDHYKKNHIEDVDMRYYRHLPDGYSMRWNSGVLKKKFTVYPRKPKQAAKDELWLTAGEMIRIHENPTILFMLKEFDGWLDRDEEERDKSEVERAIAYEKRNPPPEKLKEYRRDKNGVRWFK